MFIIRLCTPLSVLFFVGAAHAEVNCDKVSNYKDVKASGMNPIIHYIIYGYKEGKDPNKDFDGVYYSHKYGDALSSKLSPLVHYSLYGLQENREYKLDKNLFPIIPYEKVVNILKKLNNSNKIGRIIKNVHISDKNSHKPIRFDGDN